MHNQCKICAGWGVVRITKAFVCQKCNINKCCFCENRKFKGNYTECESCAGTGEIDSNVPKVIQLSAKKIIKTNNICMKQ